MKILFAAPVHFDRITIFISQYTTGLASAAETLGHEARVMNTTENIYAQFRWKPLERAHYIFRSRLKSIVDIPHDLSLGYLLLQEVKEFEPDILFIHMVDNSHTHLVINKIRRMGTCVMTWLGVHPSQVSTGIHKLARSSDYTLIYDPSYLDYYRNQLHIDNIRIVPLGCDVDYHNRVKVGQTFKKESGVDVCFAGLFDEHRERYLQELTDFDLGIWSWNIGDYDTPLKKFHKGTVHGEDLVKVLKTSSIILNIHRDFEIGGGNYRLFEIPASGAFQLVDQKTDIGKYFEIGKEIVTFSDPKDLKKKVKYYLRNPEERERIAKAGYNRVKKDHSLTDRMTKIMDIAKSRLQG